MEFASDLSRMADAVLEGSHESMRLVGLELVKERPNRWCELTLDKLVQYMMYNSYDQRRCLKHLCSMYPREYILYAYLIEVLFANRMDLVEVWYKEAVRDFTWNVELTWNMLTYHWYVMGGVDRVLDEWRRRIATFPVELKQAFRKHYIDFCMVEGLMDLPSID